MKKFLIVGFGRMGITHLAHINGYLSGDCTFDVFDPSLSFQLASLFTVRKNINFLRRLPKSSKYDAVVITSPPKVHGANFEQCFDLTERFFIEKPLGLTNKNIQDADAAGKVILCGYVLRHNPCVSYLKRQTEGQGLLKVCVDVKSNLGLNLGEDWRFDLRSGGGCLNELGSHATNIALMFRDRSLELRTDVHSLTTGAFSIDLAGGSESLISVSGDWDVDVRKTTYSLKVKGEFGELITDFQSVWGEWGGEAVKWSPRQEELDVGFYLRGVDFAVQNKSFLDCSFDKSNVSDALLTDEILAEVLCHV